MKQGKKFSAKKTQSMDKIPPTQDALLQHTYRALYQAGIWTTCTQAQPKIPSPEQFGWTIRSQVIGFQCESLFQRFQEHAVS